MKIIELLLVPSLLFVSAPLNQSNSNADDVILSLEVTNNLCSKLKNSIELNANISFHYDTYLPNLNIVDQFDSSNRVNIIKVNNMELQKSYIEKSSNGDALEQYLSISNSVQKRNITDDNGANVLFESMFASPFSRFIKLNNEKINSYFDVKETTTTYILKANSLGYGAISNQLLTFYHDYDGLLWDDSVTRSIKELTFTIDKSGNPKNLTFDKIKKDIFGGIKETYDVEIYLLSSVSSLQPCESLLTLEQSSDFKNKINNFQELLNKGNFTHNISITEQGGNEGYIYSNYYALNEDAERNFPPAILSSMRLVDATYGETFIGMFNTGSGYSTVGISPYAEYSSTINETNTTDITSLIPCLDEISADFFSYNAADKSYTFNLSSFILADSYFCDDLLRALFGIADPAVNNLGLYVDNYGYSFNYLTISFDDNSYPFGTLNFNFGSYNLVSNFSFSNVGKTSLEAEESIKDAVEYYLLKGGI